MPVAEDKCRDRELMVNSGACAHWLVSGLWLLAALAVRPLAAQGLGDEVILSRLGDPVEIEIAVNDWQHLDLKRVEIGNATHEQYESFKLAFLPLLDSLSFNVVGPNPAGKVKILVSSRKPLPEPYLDMLLVMKWPGGSSMREYVLLFDPPLPNFTGAGERSPRAPVQADTPATPAPAAEIAAREPLKPPPARPASDSKPEAKPKIAEPAKSVAKPEPPDVRTQTAIEVEQVAATTVPAKVDDGRRMYSVRNGDSLWIIARQFHPAGIGENLYQFLISLHDLNRAAFINGNISLLKAGAELHIPAARDIAAINPGTAQKVFEQLWRDGVRTHDVPADSAQFKPLNEAAEPKRQPAKTVVQKLPLGTEKREPAPASSSPLQPVPSIQVVPKQTRTGKPAPAVTDANPFLQKVTDSALAIQGLLETRKQHLQALEQQILAMQAEMQQAQRRASELNQGMATIEQRRAEVTNKAMMLGALAALLLILLLATIHFSWKWNREIRNRNRLEY
jgi:FimV-like protein